MRVWRKLSRTLWTALLGVALLGMTAGQTTATAGLYRIAVVAGCIFIITGPPKRRCGRNAKGRKKS